MIKTQTNILKQFSECTQLRDNFHFLYLVISIIFCDSFFQVILFNQIHWFAFLFNVLFTASLAYFLKLVFSFIKIKWRGPLYFLLLLANAILYGSQFIYYKFFRVLYTFYSFLNGSQVTEFLPDIIDNIINNFFYLFIFFLPSIAYLFFHKKFRFNIDKKTRLKSFIVSVACYLIAILVILTGPRIVNSPYDLYFDHVDPLITSRNFGLTTAMRVDLRNYIFPEDISREFNIQELDNFFAQRKVNPPNSHTGEFKDYNLIIIIAESFSKYSADPNLTPTLWYMQENGYSFNNYYNQLWGVSTLDGEYATLVGLSPKPGTWSLLESKDNALPFTPAHILKKEGYTTTAWHNHTYDYYRRDLSHINLGYESFIGVGNGLDISDTWPESDIELIQDSFETATRKTPFHTYYLTVSGHAAYDPQLNAIAEKNFHFVENLDLNEEAKSYMATQIELDKAMELLIKNLRKKGIADRTLIVLTADHYPYRLSDEAYNQLAGKELDKNFEVCKSSLIIFSDDMEGQKIDKPLSTLDILPTIYNLMDLSYDSRYLMGNDVFSDTESLIYFSDRSWITEDGKYDAVNHIFYPNAEHQIHDKKSYVKEIQAEVNKRFRYSSLILDTDYYSTINQEEISP